DIIGRIDLIRPYGNTAGTVVPQNLTFSTTGRNMHVPSTSRMGVNRYIRAVDLDMTVGTGCRYGGGIGTGMCRLRVIVCDFATITAISSAAGFTQCNALRQFYILRTA